MSVSATRCTAAFLVVMLATTTLSMVPPASAASIPVDLRTWTQQGVLSSGSWNVASDGSSVLQTINGGPTFFVSPVEMGGHVVRGKIKVETTSDDDMIGFVFGYKGPLASNGDDPRDYDTLVLDWKQNTQNYLGYVANRGLALYRLNGTVAGDAPILECFWRKNEDACPQLDVLATRYGSDMGWVDHTEYEFELLYTATQIRITITGGSGAFKGGLVVFDVTGEFEPGRFGFYNYSQERVRYSSFTTNDVPVPVIADVAPVECVAGGGVVTLDGTASFDPDGDELTFAWSAPGVTFDDPASPKPSAEFPLGATTVTLVVGDGISTADATLDILVHDTLAPEVAVARPESGTLYISDEAHPSSVEGLPAVAVGGLTLIAEASDLCGGITVVRFEATGGAVHEDAEAPYEFHHAPPLAEPVFESVTVTAVDAAGIESSTVASFLHVGVGSTP